MTAAFVPSRFACPRFAAQSAPAGSGFGRKRRNQHAQRRRRLAGAGASGAGAHPGLQRRNDEQCHARRYAPGRPNLGLLRNERLRNGRAPERRRHRRDSLSHDQYAEHADRSDRARVSAARRAIRDRVEGPAAPDVIAAATAWFARSSLPKAPRKRRCLPTVRPLRRRARRAANPAHVDTTL